MSLPGTKQKSGVDRRYPADSAVRCDKLMANLARRRCQAGRGGSCSTRDSLSPRPAHGNVAWKLVSGITETMFTSSDSPER